MALENDDLKFNFGCASCGYNNPSPNQPIGKIPVQNILETLDNYFNKNDLASAGRLLDYWRREAFSLRDRKGELTILSEQMGYFRKTNEKEKALESVNRGLELIDHLNIADTVSAATIFLNAATTLKAFSQSEKALPLYEKALKIYSEKLDKTDVRFAGFYNNYGLALGDLKRYDDAEKAFVSALDIVLSDTKTWLDGAVTYVNLAHLYNDWEEKSTKDVETCLDKAYELLTDESIPHDGYYAFVLTKCFPSFRCFGREAVAINMEKTAVEIYERA